MAQVAKRRELIPLLGDALFQRGGDAFAGESV